MQREKSHSEATEGHTYVVDPPMNTVLSKLTMDEKEQIGRAIGRIASGVFVVTTERSGVRDGLLASWVCQAAFAPPMLSVAIKKERHILDLLGVGRQFNVNVLSKKNMDIFKNFVSPYKEGMDRFQGLAVAENSTAGPVLADSIAYMGCITRTMVETGDHVVVIGEIIDGGLLNAEAEPMVHLRRNGFQY